MTRQHRVCCINNNLIIELFYTVLILIGSRLLYMINGFVLSVPCYSYLNNFKLKLLQKDPSRYGMSLKSFLLLLGSRKLNNRETK